jgi:hypothetical protein
MANFGLMMAFMEPPPGLEEEFNDWYDTEHLPQRQGLAGFLGATRWICIEGFPRSLAVYDLASLDVLQHPDYQAVSGPRSTPWSRRILARTARAGRSRMDGEQIWPGTAGSLGRSAVNRLLVARYPRPGDRTTFLAAAQAQFGALPQLGQLRVFVSDDAPFPAFWLLAEFKAPLPGRDIMGAGGTVAGHDPDLFNVYVPYAGS